MSPDRAELSLFRDLFDGYDKRIRPALRKEDNVTVMLGISVFQLIDLVGRAFCQENERVRPQQEKLTPPLPSHFK